MNGATVRPLTWLHPNMTRQGFFWSSVRFVRHSAQPVSSLPEQDDEQRDEAWDSVLWRQLLVRVVCAPDRLAERTITGSLLCKV